MSLRLQDKVCLITGAGSGIGRAAALLFAKEGARVAAADIDGDRAEAVAEAARALGAEALGLRVDVSRSAQVEDMVARTLGAFGRLDVLVNNAGITLAATAVETEEADWDRIMAVNVKGVFLGCKFAIPVMRRQGGGAIVNTASITASVGLRERAAYVASKGAVAALTRALALDHVGDGIRVNCVAPGTIETPFFDPLFEAAEDPAALRRDLAARQAMNRLGRPEEIAGAMLYLACDESSFVTGTMLTVDGGMTAR
ncbi:MAG: SDR family oxidoreductase [Proteobacteria bacterium]|nr:SDR family oxidoreductase [Pseudomonadota bacterium]